MSFEAPLTLKIFAKRVPTNKFWKKNKEEDRDAVTKMPILVTYKRAWMQIAKTSMSLSRTVKTYKKKKKGWISNDDYQKSRSLTVAIIFIFQKCHWNVLKVKINASCFTAVVAAKDPLGVPSNSSCHPSLMISLPPSLLLLIIIWIHHSDSQVPWPP